VGYVYCGATGPSPEKPQLSMKRATDVRSPPQTINVVDDLIPSDRRRITQKTNHTLEYVSATLSNNRDTVVSVRIPRVLQPNGCLNRLHAASTPYVGRHLEGNHFLLYLGRWLANASWIREKSGEFHRDGTNKCVGRNRPVTLTVTTSISERTKFRFDLTAYPIPPFVFLFVFNKHARVTYSAYTRVYKRID